MPRQFGDRKYQRILLKLSGEALMGELDYGIEPEVIQRIATEVAEVRELDIEVAIVIGGGNIFGTLFGGIAKAATGTEYSQGGMTLVGERGPELVNLPRGSQVYTAHQTQGMMGGVNITFAPTIDARGADQGAVARIERSLAQTKAELPAVAVQAVMKARKQGMRV